MSTDLFAKLKAPFAPDKVSWRIGATTEKKDRGLAMCYIDARDVADRLDEACGPGGWCNDYPHANGKTVCRIGIKVGDEWIFKADGAGDTDYEAEKGALSDAFKRAAVRWGVGRYLYDVPSTWVDIEMKGKTAVILPAEAERLKRLLASNGKPAANGLAGAQERAASILINELRTQKTAGALKDWGESEDVQKRIAALDTPNKERVRADFGASMRALIMAERVAA
jgi:hypothetical protein